MSGIGSVFAHPAGAAKPNGGSVLDGVSPLTMAPQFGSVAPLTLPEVSRQLMFIEPAASTAIASGALITLGTFPIAVPEGGSLVLAEVAYRLSDFGLQLRVDATNGWASSDSLLQDDVKPGTVLYENGTGSAAQVLVIFYLKNTTAGSLSTVSNSVWANLLLQ